MKLSALAGYIPFNCWNSFPEHCLFNAGQGRIYEFDLTHFCCCVLIHRWKGIGEDLLEGLLSQQYPKSNAIAPTPRLPVIIRAFSNAFFANTHPSEEVYCSSKHKLPSILGQKWGGILLWLVSAYVWGEMKYDGPALLNPAASKPNHRSSIHHDINLTYGLKAEIRMARKRRLTQRYICKKALVSAFRISKGYQPSFITTQAKSYRRRD